MNLPGRMRMTRFALLLLSTLVVLPAAATTRYVSQSGGTFSGGTACAGKSAISVATMSSTTNSAGDHDYLCGTLTSALTLNGSGSSGNVVTVTFDTGSGFSFAAIPTSGALIVNGSYYLIDGGGGSCGFVSRVDTTCSVGYIMSTANGANLANQVASVAVQLGSNSNIEVKGLLIGPVYVEVANANDTIGNNGPPGPLAVQFNGSSNILIHNNTIHDCGWCLQGGGGPSTNLQVYNNEIYYMDHGVAIGNSNTDVTVHDNNIHDMANWDTEGDTFHHDGIHIFSEPGTTMDDVTEYNNLLNGDGGSNWTAWIYNEDNGGTWENGAMFNNVAYIAGSHGPDDGALQAWQDSGSGTLNNFTAVNNTVYGASTPTGTNGTSDSQVTDYLFSSISTLTVRNNLAADAQSQVDISIDSVTSLTLSNDAYDDIGTAAATFSWGGNQFSSWTTWVSDSGETGSVFNVLADFDLNSAGQPTTGSTAIGAGANLTSMCSTSLGTLSLSALCSDAAGTARPSSGNWDIGAYQHSASGSAAPNPPTGLTVTVQ